MKLILLPGMDGTGRLFEAFLNEVSNEIDVQVVTLKPSGDQDYESQLVWVERQLPQEGNLILLAESFSGPIGLALARKLSGRVKACIFVTSFLSCPHGGLKWLGMLLPLGFLVRLTLPKFVIRNVLLDQCTSREMYDLFNRVMKGCDKGVLKKRLKVLVDLRLEDMRPLRMPCFYLEALDDKLLGDDCLESFYEVFGRVGQRRLSGPHLLLQSRPKECAAIVSSLISGLCEVD